MTDYRRLLGVALSICVAGCVSCNGTRSGSPYREWAVENKVSIASLQEIATQKGWMLIAANREGVYELDLGAGLVSEIYKTRNRLWVASSMVEGRVATIESSRRMPEKDWLVVFDVMKSKRVLQLPIESLPRCLNRPSAILLDKAKVVFPVGGGLGMYDFGEGAYRKLLEDDEEGWAAVTGVQQVGDELLVTRSRPLADRASELLVLDLGEADAPVVSHAGFRAVTLIGDRVLAEAGERIGWLDYASGEFSPVVDGILLGGVGENAFLYSSSGVSAIAGTLHVFDVAKGEGRDVGTFSLHGISNQDTMPVVSPDMRYVSVPLMGAPQGRFVESYDWHYEVRSVESGEVVGTFYNPYMGKLRFSLVLGWMAQVPMTRE